MKKQLPTAIANELAGSSVFFETATRSESQEEPTGVEAMRPYGISAQIPVVPRHHDTVVPGNGVGMLPANPGIALAAGHGDTTAAMLETIRKTVRQIGKEAATHRFTAEEKNVLADIVYTYSRQGYKTSENEITRIAVNWLLLNYQEQGEHSVLARMLESLHK